MESKKVQYHHIDFARTNTFVDFCKARNAFRMQEFYKGRKDHEFVYTSYFACHDQRKRDLKSVKQKIQLARNASSYAVLYCGATFRDIAVVLFFFSSYSSDDAFLYFQFCEFIVALAAKYKLLIRCAGRVQY